VFSPFIDLAHLLCYDPFFFELWGIMSGQRDHFLAKSLESLQENIRRSGPAATASYTLVGAVLLLGGIGYLLDQWLMTSPWFLLGGLLLGMVVGFYEIAKAVWKR
jgi:F0F1-type ATP synthase assembly protein I